MQPDIVMTFINVFVDVSDYQIKKICTNLPHTFKKFPAQFPAQKSPFPSYLKHTSNHDSHLAGFPTSLFIFWYQSFRLTNRKQTFGR
jgi:hypothetical protein